MAALKNAALSDLIRYYHNRLVFSQCSQPSLLKTLPFGLQLQALIEGTCNLLTKRLKAPIDSHMSHSRVWRLSVLTWNDGGLVLLQGSKKSLSLTKCSDAPPTANIQVHHTWTKNLYNITYCSEKGNHTWKALNCMCLLSSYTAFTWWHFSPQFQTKIRA